MRKNTILNEHPVDIKGKGLKNTLYLIHFQYYIIQDNKPGGILAKHLKEQ